MQWHVFKGTKVLFYTKHVFYTKYSSFIQRIDGRCKYVVLGPQLIQQGFSYLIDTNPSITDRSPENR